MAVLFTRQLENTSTLINPSRYRQLIEAERIEKLDTSEQANLSEDQKHTSAVSKMHYQKRKSEDIAAKAKDHG